MTYTLQTRLLTNTLTALKSLRKLCTQYNMIY